MDAMMREEALAGLSACQANKDHEMAHEQADEILCELLASLGYEDVVEAFEKVHKWYA